MTTFSDRLRLALQGTGENNNTWGTVANTVFRLVEEALAGYLSKDVAGSGSVTLTTANNATDEARYRIIEFTGVLTGNRDIIIPSQSKEYLIYNNTSGSFTLTIKTSGGAGAVVGQGGWGLVVCDGTDCVEVLGSASILVDDDNFKPGGKEWAVAHGGTGASDAATARANLGVTYDVPLYRLGKPAAGETMLQMIVVRGFSIPAGATNSRIYVSTTPSANATFTLQKNGSSFGTVTVNSGANTGSFSVATETSFVAGDRLEVIAPNPQDGTMADISMTLVPTY